MLICAGDESLRTHDLFSMNPLFQDCIFSPGAKLDDALGAYERAYSGKPFVRMRLNNLPSTKYVANTNFADISVKLYNGRFVVLCAIDNMVKGAAGQAIENMNLMFGIDETSGLL